MPQSLFLQNKIAVIWDFDKTLIPGYMQEPLFQEYNIDGDQFWKEVAELPEFYADRRIHVSKDTAYLNHILTYVRSGVMKGLSNARLRQLGAKLELYPGLPEFLKITKEAIRQDPTFAQHEIEVEHYVVSTGIKPMIDGSAVAPYLEGIWACEFIEEVAPPGQAASITASSSGAVTTTVAVRRSSKRVRHRSQQIGLAAQEEISQIGYMLDNTTKTRAIFEINKGTNRHPRIDVNASIRQEDRRVPFQNMIYIADGPSDIPCFSIVGQYGGKTFAVYRSGSTEEFAQVNSLQHQGRVQSYGEANYEEGSQTYMWILHSIQNIASRIVENRTRALTERVHAPPNHITVRNGAGLNRGNGKASHGYEPTSSDETTQT